MEGLECGKNNTDDRSLVAARPWRFPLNSGNSFALSGQISLGQWKWKCSVFEGCIKFTQVNSNYPQDLIASTAEKLKSYRQNDLQDYSGQSPRGHNRWGAWFCSKLYVRGIEDQFGCILLIDGAQAGEHVNFIMLDVSSIETRITWKRVWKLMLERVMPCLVPELWVVQVEVYH